MHLRTILHPTACTESSRPVLQHAVELAREQGGRLVIVHAVDTAQAAQVTYKEAISKLQPQARYRCLWERLRRWVQANQVSDELQILLETDSDARGYQLRCGIHLPGLAKPAELILAEGDPGPVIVRTAADFGCELIVLPGPRQPRRWTRVLFPSVPEYVLAHAPCSVLAVKTSGPEQTLPRTSQTLSPGAKPDPQVVRP